MCIEGPSTRLITSRGRRTLCKLPYGMFCPTRTEHDNEICLNVLTVFTPTDRKSIESYTILFAAEVQLPWA